MMRIAKATKSLFKEKCAIITSDALDFAGIRGNGLKIDTKSKFFHKVHEVELIRLSTQEIPDIMDKGTSIKKPEGFNNFVHSLCLKQTELSGNALRFFYRNGPSFYHQDVPFLDHVKNQFKNSDFGELESLDYVFCTYVPYANLLYSLSLSEQLNIPSFCTPFLHPENPRYDYNAIYETLNMFTGLFACTEFEKELMIKNGIDKNKIEVIPMGIDFDKFERNETRSESFLNKFGLTDPYILFCGYKNYEKGALSMLKALHILFEKGISVGVVFIGPTTKAFNAEWKKLVSQFPERQLVNLTPNNMIGYFDQKKIAAFNECLCYCMPSRSEAYGIAYLESWACKKPVIAANIPAMREVVRDGIDGMLVDFDVPNQIADKIRYFYDNKDIAKEMGLAGYQKIIETNQWHQIAQNIRNFIEKKITENKK